MDQVVANVPRMSGRFDTYAPRHAVAMAWDRTRFELLDQSWMEIGSDQYGQRITAWVRLRDLQNTGSTVFFANTHGPLSGCSTPVGDNWLRAVAQLVQT